MVKEIEKRKLVAVGLNGVGKRSLIYTVVNNQFPYYYRPLFDTNQVFDLEIDEHCIELHLWNTPGYEDYDRLRPLAYGDTNVVLLCFSIDSSESLEAIESKFVPEVKEHCPGVPYILVANKSDLRTSEHAANLKLIQTEQGRAVADQIGAFAYLECSAMLIEGVKEAFETAARAALQQVKKRKHRKCILM